MTMTAVRYPVAPTVTPRRGTLLHAATASSDYAWMDGNDLFESYNCMNFGAAANFCAPNDKTFDQSPVWVDGIHFNAYGGVSCRAVGFDMDKARTEVDRVFRAGESAAVERALMEMRFVADAGGSPRWGAPTDLTPAGGAVKPKEGIALLEGYAASVYTGVPTLHLPIFAASVAALDAGLEWQGDVLHTKLGSKVVAGAGYDHPNTGPTGAEPATGERWLYASGEVVVVSSPDFEVRDAVDMVNNDIYVLAERAYVAAVDCFTAAVRVTITA